MEIYHIRTFLAVVRAGNATQAAEHLNISQPAVSQRIKALEDEFGFVLFDRKISGLSLNQFGGKLSPLCERIIVDSGLLNDEASRIRDEITGTKPIGLAGFSDLGR